MKANQKRRLKQQLLHRKDMLLDRHQARLFRVNELAKEIGGDILDGATRENTINTQLLLENLELSELRRIEEAQFHLLDDNFGCCCLCGKGIQIQRLLIIPETSFCYDCAVTMETHEGKVAQIQGEHQNAR